MKEHGAVENHVADYRERFFEPDTVRHNPFNAENFSYHHLFWLSHFFLLQFLFLFLSFYNFSYHRLTNMTPSTKRVLLNRVFLISLHPLAFSIHLQISSAAPPSCSLTVRSAFVSSALYTPGFWKISRWLSCLEETYDAVGGTF